MRKGYVELQELNRELISGYQVRSTNHQELVKSLKIVNQIIQKAAQLRGKYGQSAKLCCAAILQAILSLADFRKCQVTIKHAMYRVFHNC